MKYVIEIIIDLYFAFSFMRAGYAYCEMKKESKNKSNLFINALFYGFFGWFIELFYLCSKRCGNCLYYSNKRCKNTGKFTGSFCKECKKFKRK